MFFFFQKCSDYKASDVPTFARTEPPDTQVSIFLSRSFYKDCRITTRVLIGIPCKSSTEQMTF